MSEDNSQSTLPPRQKLLRSRKLLPTVLDEKILPPARIVEEEERLKIGPLLGYEAWAWYQTLLGWIPGRIGWIVRRIAYQPFFQRAGKGWHVGEFCSIQRVQYFQVGHLFAIGRYCVINALGGVILGDYSGIGPFTQIMSSTHNFRKEKITGYGIGLSSRLLETAPVVIESYAWVGAGSIIMPGVRIGENSIVAAGATVTKDVPPFSMVAGVPAKVVWIKTQEERESSEGDFVYRSIVETYNKSRAD